MKKLTLALLLVSFLSKAQFIIDNKWQLIPTFSDEFDTTIINTTKWKGILGFEDLMNAPGGNCIYDDTAAAFIRPNYPNENVILDNGIVHLLVRNIPTDVIIKCDNSDIAGDIFVNTPQTVTYTTGALISKNTVRFGYLELKFRIPGPAPGDSSYWPFAPNFWIYNQYKPEDTTKNSCYSEIDIFEIFDGETQSYTTNSHFNHDYEIATCNTSNTAHHDDNHYSQYGAGNFGPRNIEGNVWHTAAAHWSPDRVDFYLDGQIIKTNHQYWVGVLDPMFIIINMNVPKTASNRLDNPNYLYPYSYDIDYIRVYQLVNDGCGIDDEFYCGTEPPSTDGDIILKSAVFGGSGCGGANFTHMDNSLYANDYILIDENTTLGGGTGTVYLDVNKCYNP